MADTITIRITPEILSIIEKTQEIMRRRIPGGNHTASAAVRFLLIQGLEHITACSPGEKTGEGKE